MLVDAGPLVALLSDADAAHVSCTTTAQTLRLPMLTTWLVLAEAAWLLRRAPEGVERLLQLLSGGVIVCPAFDEHAPDWMVSCLRKYASLRPQLADVSLLYLAEREGIATVFTLDRRDFTVFRGDGGKAFNLVPN
ncbi:MAG: PIN domain-containing protein [Pirellulales bacterium]|nr:PIN domain-containing protein [Pirellulales bacterium]